MKKYYKLLLILLIFSIAMGYLESAVVVYLRQIIYPEGFYFPLKPFPSLLAKTELIREVATIIMLLSIALLAGKTFIEITSFFLYCFAIWDITYYIFLKILLNWPKNILEWDILFLIPTTWTAPVLCPIIVSLNMIIISIIFLLYEKRNIKIPILLWIGLIIGGFFFFLSFIWDYMDFLIKILPLSKILSFSNEIIKTTYSYVPSSFQWSIFLIAQLIIILVLIFAIIRLRK